MTTTEILNNPIIKQIDYFLKNKTAMIFKAQNELKDKGYELTDYEKGYRNGMISLITELNLHILLKVEIDDNSPKD